MTRHLTHHALSAAVRMMRKMAMVCLLGLPLAIAAQPALAKSPPTCNSSDASQVRLQISVTGMRSTEGNITITIYSDEPSHFLDGKFKLARQILPVTSPITTACFVMDAPGTYAVALFHDKNSNHHFDTNFLGIPVEGYGFSNNPTLFVGPPKLKQVAITAHKGDNAISVQLKHY